jgi:hypothetical protein
MPAANFLIVEYGRCNFTWFDFAFGLKLIHLAAGKRRAPATSIGGTKMAKEKTSKKVASIAGKLLGKRATPKPVRRVAASALTQYEPRKPSKSGAKKK